MKRNVFLGVIVAGLALSCYSCSKVTDETVTPSVETSEQVLSKTAISKEEAIAGLSSLLQSWCKSELRSGEASYVSHSRMLAQLSNYKLDEVQTVRSGISSPRSAAAHSSQESRAEDSQLMHLVNFDGGGYAVVSADRRIPSFVLAVVDDGTIKEEDFHAADSIYTEEDIRKEIPDFKMLNDTLGDFYSMSANRAYVNRELYNYASSYTSASCSVNDMSDPYDPSYDRWGEGEYRRPSNYNCTGNFTPRYPRPGIDEGDTPNVTKTSSWVVEKEVPMMIQTIWFQDSPFNDLTPIRKKFWLFGKSQHAPAGCGPIALAQILTYMNDVNYRFNGRLIDYERLQNFCTLSNPSTEGDYVFEKDLSAYFLASLGQSLGTVYGYSFGLTLPCRVKSFLEHYGYRDVKRAFNPSERKKNVLEALDNGCPVFITSGSSLFSFHSWVIDGYRKEALITSTKDTKTNKVISSSRTNETLYVHCNYGWRGTCNGFYTYDVFDTRAGAKEYSEEEKVYRNGNTGKGTKSYHILTNVITFRK